MPLANGGGENLKLKMINREKEETMKKTIFATLVCALLSSSAFADHVVQFTYDQAGNRIGRAIVLPAASSALRDAAPNDSTTAVFTDTFAEMTLNVYPNPTHGNLKIELAGLPDEDTYGFVIVNMSGDVIVQNDKAVNPSEIELSPFPTGVYILKLFYKEIMKDYKIIKL